MAVDIVSPGAKETKLRAALLPLIQVIAISRTTELPLSPSDGDIYIVPADELSNANDVALRSEGAWIYHSPTEGWNAYVLDESLKLQFDGSDWIEPPSASLDLDDLGDVNVSGASEGDLLTYSGSAGWTAEPPAASSNPTESIIVAASDETTAITTGTAKTTFRMPYAFTVTAVRASLTTAQVSGSIFTVDINEAGATILSTKLTIDNTEKTSTTAATPAVISDASLADDAEITIDVDQIGSGEAAGLKVVLIGTRT